MTDKLLILLYHDLDSDTAVSEKESRAARDTVVHVTEFEKQMRFLWENGYSTVSISEYLCFTNPSQMRNKIIITFDDGHWSNYFLAWPVLKKYGFTASFFIVGDRIGKPYHMTGPQIRELAGNGMEIGSHGHTHRFLPLLVDKAVEEELMDSKAVLEKVIKKPVPLFAFPGGHYNRKILHMLRECGYSGACSCIQGLNPVHPDPYLLKRIEVRQKTTIKDFSKIFDPTLIFFYQAVDMIKYGIRRMVGLQNYARLRQRLYKLYLFKR